METKEERITKGQEHYETRSKRRPKQTWDDVTKEWVKTEKQEGQ